MLFCYNIDRLGATYILLHNNVVQIYCPSGGRFKAGGPHAIQGKRERLQTPFTTQAINHLAVSATVTHSSKKLAMEFPPWKLAEFTSLC